MDNNNYCDTGNLFIINNTRPVPDHGSYPPGFNPQSAEKFLHQNK